MWEYDRISFEAKTILQIVDNLNKLGAENWEIIYYDEKKPEKYGLPYNVILLVKRLKI